MTGGVTRKLDKVTRKISGTAPPCQPCTRVQPLRAGILGKLTLALPYLQNQSCNYFVFKHDSYKRIYSYYS